MRSQNKSGSLVGTITDCTLVVLPLENKTTKLGTANVENDKKWSSRPLTSQDLVIFQFWQNYQPMYSFINGKNIYIFFILVDYI